MFMGALPPSPLIRTFRCAKRCGGFSLLEILAVMLLLGVLTSAVLPAFNSIAGGQGFAQGVYEIRDLLELARSEAIARQTYVWVGFQNVQTTTGCEIQMAAVASMDGSGTNTSAANLAVCSRVLHVRDARLSQWSALSASMQSMLSGTTPSSIAVNTQGIAFSAGAASFSGGYTLTYTPRGEALLKGAASSTDGYDPLIDVSIQKAHGTTVSANAENASVLVQGATGALRIMRP